VHDEHKLVLDEHELVHDEHKPVHGELEHEHEHEQQVFVCFQSHRPWTYKCMGDEPTLLVNLEGFESLKRQFAFKNNKAMQLHYRF
jgi:hypothetical protein